MFATLPLICLALIGTIFYKKTLWGRRHCSLVSLIVLGTLFSLSTEALSLIHGLTTPLIAIFWLIILCAGIFLLFHIPNTKNKAFFIKISKENIFEVGISVVLALILISVGVIAWTAPPNNWDSMTYHMSRVMHWIQDKSLDHYPTHIIRQLTYPPAAEYIILQLQLLSHSDRWANFIQWFSLLGCAFSVSLIARQLGGTKRAQMLASVFSVTLPMGLLQGSSTQNDYVLALWLTCFIYFLLKLINDSPSVVTVLCGGLSLGLALFTKGTAYIYALPFLLWALFLVIKKYKKRSIKSIAIVFVCILIINGGYFNRMLHLNGRILPGSESPQAQVEKITLLGFTANIIRNTALHLGTPYPSINQKIDKAVNHVLLRLGIDPEHDPAAFGGYAFMTPVLPFHEDHSANLLHLMIILGCLLSIIIALFRRRLDKTLVPYLTCVLGAFFLFSLLLKWQPWHSRLHLPLFILWAPLAGILLSKIRHTAFYLGMAFLMVACSLPWVIRNQSRPLTGAKNIFNQSRTEQYFANKPYLSFAYQMTAQYSKEKKYRQLGISLSKDGWEYPIWPLLQDNLDHPFRIEHVNVDNITTKKNIPYPLGEFSPSLLIFIETKPRWSTTLNNTLYVKTRRYPPIDIFEKDQTGLLLKTNLLEHFQALQNAARFSQQHAKELAQNPAKHFQFRQQEYLHALLVDADELNRIFPGMGDMYLKEFMPGVEQRLQGLQTGQQRLYQQGEEKILHWQQWIASHKEAIEQAFRQY